MDLVEFLRARWDETEARARLALEVVGGDWDSWEVVAQQLHACCNTVPKVGRVGQLLQHEGDPARVLTEVEAKRQILDKIVPRMNEMDDQIDGEWGVGDMDPSEYASVTLLRLLALPYDDHPNFQQEWKP